MGAYIINVPDTVDTIIYVNIGDVYDGKTYIASQRVEDLTPYTEPDLEQMRKEAYEKGYENGFVAGHLKAEKSGQSFYEDGYKRGLADAWEAARKICTNWVLSDSVLSKIFGMDKTIDDIMKESTASEAIEKIRAYEQEKEEIHLGDEVTFLPNNAKGIVSECHVPDVYSDNDKYAVWCGGTMEYVLKQHLTKTGRTFPEIAEVLAKMKESDNG